MFFLLRASLWIAAIIVLVPMLPSINGGDAPPATGPAAVQPAAPAAAVGTAPATAPQVSAVAQPAATAVPPGPALPAAVDVVRFCLDNGAICEAGLSAVAALGDAVGHGLELAATLQHGTPPQGAPAQGTPAPAAYDPPPLAVATTAVRVAPLPPAVAGTLTAADRAEPWIAEAAAVAARASAVLPPTFRLPVPDPRRRPAG